MQLTTRGRYAVAAMLELSFNSTEKPMKLHTISQRQNLSLSYLEQLFAKLKKASLVKSVQGPGGGYLLGRSSNEVNLIQIIEAVDENIDLRRCHGKRNCNNGAQCVSHQLWSDTGKQLRAFLKSKNLQQIASEYKLRLIN